MGDKENFFLMVVIPTYTVNREEMKIESHHLQTLQSNLV